MSDDKILMNFSNIVLSYAVNATIHLGLSPEPATGQIAIDLNRAKDLIDMLDVLRDKTKGNLTEDEEKIEISVFFFDFSQTMFWWILKRHYKDALVFKEAIKKI